jgi:hypothetical protein
VAKQYDFWLYHLPLYLQQYHVMYRLYWHYHRHLQQYQWSNSCLDFDFDHHHQQHLLLL